MNAWLIPQTVYVGDRATLVVPLDNLPAGESLFPGEPPALPDLAIHRIELERRGEGGRLLIDFTAYAPGPLEIPPFELEGIPFTGLTIEIASILGSGEHTTILSPLAPPLAIPGTGFLIYGTMAGLILIILTFLGAVFWAPRRAAIWLEGRRRKRLVLSLAGMERRLRRELIRGNTTASQRRERLNFLAGEFRTFLALFTGENCRAMTAGELSRLSLAAERCVPENPGARIPPENSPPGGDFLGGFFRRCDDLRFSGTEISAEELLKILEDLKLFAGALKTAGDAAARAVAGAISTPGAGGPEPERAP
jgi:hypothetical protein